MILRSCSRLIDTVLYSPSIESVGARINDTAKSHSEIYLKSVHIFILQSIYFMLNIITKRTNTRMKDEHRYCKCSQDFSFVVTSFVLNLHLYHLHHHSQDYILFKFQHPEQTKSCSCTGDHH